MRFFSYQTSPEVLSLRAVAVRAHLMVDSKLNHKNLLQDGGTNDLTLHSELKLDTTRVRFSPQETSINKLHTV